MATSPTIPSGDDAVFGWKTGGVGGSNPRFSPPGVGTGAGAAGLGGGAGGGGLFGGIYNQNLGGFDPYSQLRKLLGKGMSGGVGGQLDLPTLMRLLQAMRGPGL